MKCPTCKEVNLVMTDRQGIEVDYCPECRGVWLDRGELDKIIERSTSNPPPQRPEAIHDRSQHHDRNDYHYKQKKRKSFLGELFDF